MRFQQEVRQTLLPESRLIPLQQHDTTETCPQLLLRIPAYQIITVTDNLSGSRRQVLRAVGIGTTVALAGCSGSGGGDSSDDEESTNDTPDSSTQQDSTREEESTSTTDSEPTESGQTGEGYPSQSSDGFKKTLNNSVNNREHLYAFEVNGMEHINLEGINSGGEKYNEGRERLNLEEALFVAATDAGPREKPSEAYFVVSDPELSSTPPYIGMHPVDENGNINQTDESVITGYMDEVISEADDFDPDTAQSQLESFFRERIDGDPVGAGGGIDHAVDLEDFPYAVEALQSGYDAS